MDLKGRQALIIGGSQGLGAHIARTFVQEGASVFLCARSSGPLQALQGELQSNLLPDQQVHSATLDIACHESVLVRVAEVLEQFPNLEILVNCAGIHGPIEPLVSADWQEWVHAVEVNCMGAASCCKAVLPHFVEKRYGKIILLSGGGATKPMPRFSAYAASKAAVVRLAETLAQEVSEYNIDVNTIAPGALRTRLTDEVMQCDPEKVGVKYYTQLQSLLKEGGTPLDKAAALAVYLASTQSDGISGRLISAPWDPWAQLHLHKEVLMNSDIYALRRIVPSDRDVEWEEV